MKLRIVLADTPPNAVMQAFGYLFLAGRATGPANLDVAVDSDNLGHQERRSRQFT